MYFLKSILRVELFCICNISEEQKIDNLVKHTHN